ncbi:MAG TPA: type II toxin-antitoxin system prevent-host-death family antitoxin [Caldilineaceae bacterium]|nr:type II toxin-antitoxin system prevent-host-death family antitoxin [Caldilineaceae bacterium]
METTVGIRELKANLSAFLQKVKAGSTIVITEHGKPIGRITPLPKSREERLQAMIDTGLISWSGKPFMPIHESELAELEPEASKTVSDILLEDRR